MRIVQKVINGYIQQQKYKTALAQFFVTVRKNCFHQKVERSTYG